MQSAEALSILEHIKPRLFQYQQEQIKLIYYMIFINLSEQEQIHQAVSSIMATRSATINVDDEDIDDDSEDIYHEKNNKSITASINNLLNYTFLACQTLISTSELSSNGFHLSELLDVIDKLFVHDAVVKYFDPILTNGLEDEDKNDSKDTSADNKIESKKSLIHLFCESLVACRGGYFKGDKLEKLTINKLLHIIWSLTLQDERATACIKSNIELIIVLQSLASPKCNNCVAQCILTNVDEIPMTSRTKSPALEYVLISFTSSEQTFCANLLEKLQRTLSKQAVVRLQPDINRDQIDSDCCRYPWSECSMLINKSVVFLVILSKHYFESRYCRQMATYACSNRFELQRTLLFIHPNLNEKYIPIKDSWLGRIYSSSPATDVIGFSNGTIDDKNLSVLKKKIEQVLSLTRTPKWPEKTNPQSKICILL